MNLQYVWSRRKTQIDSRVVLKTREASLTVNYFSFAVIEVWNIYYEYYDDINYLV
jgi:hypothetical protein